MAGVAEVASVLGVRKSAVRKAIARGRLRATLRPGGRGGRGEYDIEADAVDEYRREHQRGGQPSTD